MRKVPFLFSAAGLVAGLVVAACGGKIAGSDLTTSGTTEEEAPPSAGSVPPSPGQRPKAPPPPSGRDAGEADAKCKVLQSISARLEAESASELEKRLDGSWYACGGAKAMSALFADVRLTASRGIAFKKDYAHSLQVHANKIEAMTCDDCFVDVAHVDGTTALVGGDEILIGFVGGNAGLVLSKSDALDVYRFVRVP